jgi:hypothetical protein
MKQETENNTINTESTSDLKNAPLTENRLYNLLFAGRITLKEYLQVSKKMG